MYYVKTTGVSLTKIRFDCALVTCTPPHSIGLVLGCALFWCWVSLCSPFTISLIEFFLCLCKCATLWMFQPLDIRLEYWIEHVAFGLLFVMFTFPTRIFYKGVPGFATGCPFGVCCRGSTTCLLYVGPLFVNLVWNDSAFVSLTLWKTTFLLLFWLFHMYLNASQYNDTLLSFTVLPCLK